MRNKMSENVSIDVENLEGNGFSSSVATPSLSLLNDAKRYAISLDDLENPDAPLPQLEMPKQQKKVKKEKYFWQDLDVNLNDIVNLVMNTSERPIIMVCDDKAIYFNFTERKNPDDSDDTDSRDNNYVNCSDILPMCPPKNGTACIASCPRQVFLSALLNVAVLS